MCGCGPLIGTLTIADGGVVNSPGFTGIAQGSTLNLGVGGLAGAIVTPAIVNDGQIIANFTDTLTLAAAISGAGALSKAGAGTLILTGSNTYSGGTTITGGTLQLGNGGASGSIAGDVVNNGTFAINCSDTFAFGGCHFRQRCVRADRPRHDHPDRRQYLCRRHGHQRRRARAQRYLAPTT
jgi:autotransporter-associated beta strand protein